MEITDIRIRKIDTDTKMKAVCSITLNDCIVIHDIKVIEGGAGLFLAMPSRKNPEGQFIDIVHPINSATREYIHKEVIQKYESM